MSPGFLAILAVAGSFCSLAAVFSQRNQPTLNLCGWHLCPGAAAKHQGAFVPFRTEAVAALLLAVLTVASVLTTASSPRPSRPSAPDAGTITVRGYASALAPRLAAVADQAAELAALGERRSRNLFELRSAQSRMEETLAAVDTIAGAGPLPASAVSAVASYRTGAALVRDAMAEAQAGFLRFDWDRVAKAYAEMDAGAAQLRRARDQLSDDVVASPAPTDEAAASLTPVRWPLRTERPASNML